MFTKFDQRLRPEGGGIVSDNLTWATESGYDVFQEFDDYFVRSAPGGDSLYPLGEIISCSEDPSMLAT